MNVLVLIPLRGKPVLKVPLLGMRKAVPGKWIGVDLDSTLAHHETGDQNLGYIGDPIPAMVERVKQWLADGQEVRIFTARVADDFTGDIKRRIQAWCLEHIGAVLPVTNAKDYGMIELWDDRAVQVVPNTGEPVVAQKVHKHAPLRKRTLSIVQAQAGMAQAITKFLRKTGDHLAVKVRGYEKVTKFNENHDEQGRFAEASSDGQYISEGVTYTDVSSSESLVQQMIGDELSVDVSAKTRAVLDDYQVGKTGQVNEALRTGKDLDQHKDAIRVLDKVLNNNPLSKSIVVYPLPMSVAVYRGFAGKEEMLTSMQSGSSFVDKGYSSTALDRITPLAIVGNEDSPGHTIARILLDKGFPAANISREGDPPEVLIARNTQYAFVSRETAKDEWGVRYHIVTLKASRERAVKFNKELHFAEGNPGIPIWLHKADEPTAEQLLKKLLPINWEPLLEELEPYMDEIAVQGGVQALTGLNITNADMISAVNEGAANWAAQRAAEMVGMKYINGVLHENPNAKWAISETTRDAINELVTNAFEARTSMAELASQIQEAGTFSESRAMMIARTEGNRAQTQGNMVGWKESGVVESVELLLSDDHTLADECDDYAEGGPFPLDDAPEVPVHPYCECVLVVSALSGDSAEKLAKFNENHDEQGRFAESSSSKVDEATQYKADQVRQLGREWVASMAANDPKFAEANTKVEKLTKQIDKLQKQNERNLAIVDRFGAMKTEERTPAEQEKFKAAIDSLDSTVIKQGDLEYERNAAERVASNQVQAWINDPSRGIGSQSSKEIGVSVPWIALGEGQARLPEAEAQRVTGYINEFNAMVGGPPAMGKEFVSVEPLPTGGGFGRSYYMESHNAIVLTNGVDRSTTWHEMGHWLETNTPGGVQAAKAFVETRTVGETPQRLNTLKSVGGQTMSWMRDDEIAKADKFRDAYVGKLYQHNATEVTSMGIQYLAESPSQFFKMDRDHFEFTVGMIRGARQGGWQWLK